MNQEQRLSALSAVLFAHGEPLAPVTIAAILNRSLDEVKIDIDLLASYLADNKNLGFYLRKINDEYFFSTKPELNSIVKNLFSPEFRSDLSNASYEVLAVIAYNQPLTRAEIEAVRGVNSDYSISKLLERGLIEVIGQAELPGKPSLFACTDLFLKQMGLETMTDLPTIDLLMYDTVKKMNQKIDQKID